MTRAELARVLERLEGQIEELRRTLSPDGSGSGRVPTVQMAQVVAANTAALRELGHDHDLRTCRDPRCQARVRMVRAETLATLQRHLEDAGRSDLVGQVLEAVGDRIYEVLLDAPQGR